MLGGLAIVGAVGGMGGSVAAAALTAGTSDQVQENVVFLQALALTRRELQLASHNHPEWFVLTVMDAQLAAEREKLSHFSDDGAPTVKELDRKLKHVRRAATWLRELGLGPAELPSAPPKALPSAGSGTRAS